MDWIGLEIRLSKRLSRKRLAVLFVISFMSFQMIFSRGIFLFTYCLLDIIRFIHFIFNILLMFIFLNCPKENI